MKALVRNSIQVLSPFAILLLFSACNAKVDGPQVSTKADISPKPAAGAPSTPAQGSGSPQDAKPAQSLLEGKWSGGCVPMNGLYGKMTAEFHADQVTRDLNLFGDSNCSSPMMSNHEAGTFSIGGAIPGLTNAYSVDFTIVQNGMTEMEYSVFQIEGDHLYMGDKGQSPEHRPTTVDRDHPLIQVTQ